MSSDPIQAAVRAEQFRSRANNFRNAGLGTRIPQDFKDAPHLLEADLAFLVMCALCAAEEADIILNLDEAVAAGRELFEDFMQQVRGQ